MHFLIVLHAVHLNAFIFMAKHRQQNTQMLFQVPAASVIPFSTYQNETFGDLKVSKGTAIEGCIPMPTHTFAKSL